MQKSERILKVSTTEGVHWAEVQLPTIAQDRVSNSHLIMQQYCCKYQTGSFYNSSCNVGNRSLVADNCVYEQSPGRSPVFAMIGCHWGFRQL